MAVQSCDDLPGWAEADFAGPAAAYALTADLAGSGWPVFDGTDARAFFGGSFEPAGAAQEGLLTGYYEPEVEGSRTPDARFGHALYGPPPGLRPGDIWADRAEIEDRGLLAGLELVWLDSAIEAFLAQVQGSVRVRLRDGGTVRLGYAGKNGHPYRSIGRELSARGEAPPAGMTTGAIRDWCARNPGEVQGLLRTNPSFVFFRVLDLPAGSGPPGAMGRPVTPLCTLAVDPAHVPLGAPVWVESFGPERLCRLMIAQDTGSAIRGPGRGDVFFGTGAAAGERAGRMAEPGRLTVLRPRAAS